MTDAALCHACGYKAYICLRVVPYSKTRTLWDAAPRDIFACPAHIDSARKIGTVIGVNPITADVVYRQVAP